jgi:hypothetical protein
MDVAAYREAIGLALGTAVDPANWPNEVIDQGLRMALAEYEQAAPPASTLVHVDTTGYLQDLGAVANLGLPLAIAWPWDGAWNTAERAELWVRWELCELPPGDSHIKTAGGRVVRLLDVCPSAGEYLLLKYRRVFKVSGLDGEPDTTVPTGDEFMLVVGGAAHAAEVRLRQLSEEIGVPDGTVPGLRASANRLMAGFTFGLDRLGALAKSGGVNWGNIGL